MFLNENRLRQPQIKRLKYVLGLLIAMLTLVAYGQVVGHTFLIYDDGQYVTENLNVKRGITGDNIFWAFSDHHTGNWHPLTWLSHMLDVQLFGLDPGLHHLVSLLFHMTNALLLFMIFVRFSRKIWPSAIIAALFAVHPLHVESVAWISERKDVLSTFFGLLTILAYGYYTTRPSIRRFLPVISFFILGLMAKPMLVTLPFVLLLIDFWPLQRFGSNDQRVMDIPTISPLIIEKIPLFTISVVAALIAFLSQRGVHATASLDLFPIHIRLLNAVVSYGIYLWKTIWPLDLAAFYPHVGMPSVLQIVLSLLCLAGFTAIAIKTAFRRSWFIVGWLWYLGTLLPVIGVIQVGLQARADRYTYIPIIGLFIIIAWEWFALWEQKQYLKKGFMIIAVFMIVILTALTWRQTAVWVDSRTLFEHALEKTKNNFLAHNSLGNIEALEGDYSAAAAHYRKALEIRPVYATAHYNLAHALVNQKKYQPALEHFAKALQIKPNDAAAHNYKGYTLLLMGKPAIARIHIMEAIRLKPSFSAAHYNAGLAYRDLGRNQRAAEHFLEAIERDPDFIPAYFQLGNVFLSQGRLTEAFEAFQKVVRRNQRHAAAHYRLGMVMLKKGKGQMAANYFKTALGINPGFTDAEKALKIAQSMLTKTNQ